MAEEFFEQIKLFLPKYLTPEQKEQLFSELKTFPNCSDFYLDPPHNFEQSILQGDAWKGFVVIEFDSLKKKEVTGLVISNSCDVDTANERNLPVSILFSPLMNMSKYGDLLRDAGKSTDQIEGIFSSIRKQTTTSIFYLPPSQAHSIPESMVALDAIHNQPLESFIKGKNKKVFTLSQYGFYILLIKLSIHFSRFNEGVARFPGTPTSIEKS